jgi:hypothetical protein
MPHRKSTSLAVVALLSGVPSPCESAEPLCWFERQFFREAATVAAETHGDAVAPAGSTRETLLTPDGVRLCGFKLAGEPQGGSPGYLLFIQGNGWTAEAALEMIQPLARTGLDVFVFDFRGYGCSEGEALVAHMFEDFGLLIERLDSRYPAGLHALYGISWGGVVLLNALPSGAAGYRLVLDSVPDQLPLLAWCPRDIYPESRMSSLDDRRTDVLLILNGDDKKVKPRNMSGLVRAARRPTLLRFDDLQHPLEGSPEEEARRLTAVAEFLTRRAEVPAR